MSNRKIVNAYQNGNSVRVEVRYDSGQGGSFSVPGQLLGFSENMVSVRDGNYTNTYDAENHRTASRPC